MGNNNSTYYNTKYFRMSKNKTCKTLSHKKLDKNYTLNILFKDVDILFQTTDNLYKMCIDDDSKNIYYKNLHTEESFSTISNISTMVIRIKNIHEDILDCLRFAKNNILIQKDNEEVPENFEKLFDGKIHHTNIPDKYIDLNITRNSDLIKHFLINYKEIKLTLFFKITIINKYMDFSFEIIKINDKNLDEYKSNNKEYFMEKIKEKKEDFFIRLSEMEKEAKKKQEFKEQKEKELKKYQEKRNLRKKLEEINIKHKKDLDDIRIENEKNILQTKAQAQSEMFYVNRMYY
uniref:Uncharacterized protein n=1 Tax=viral metagenome TaxID=1070528 RepID=A0A6C0ADT0_9ZZZZ